MKINFTGKVDELCLSVNIDGLKENDDSKQFPEICQKLLADGYKLFYASFFNIDDNCWLDDHPFLDKYPTSDGYIFPATRKNDIFRRVAIFYNTRTFFLLVDNKLIKLSKKFSLPEGVEPKVSNIYAGQIKKMQDGSYSKVFRIRDTYKTFKYEYKQIFSSKYEIVFNVMEDGYYYLFVGYPNRYDIYKDYHDEYNSRIVAKGATVQYKISSSGDVECLNHMGNLYWDYRVLRYYEGKKRFYNTLRHMSLSEYNKIKKSYPDILKDYDLKELDELKKNDSI